MNVDLLLWVERHEFVTCRQIAKYKGYAHAVAARKLARLQAAGYLKRWRPQGEFLQPYSYYITEKGARLIRWEYGLGEEEVLVHNAYIRASTIIKHVLGVNDYFCELILVSRGLENAGLLRWLNSRECVSTVPQTAEEIRPDSYAEFDTGENMVPIFFEFDRRTESSRNVVRKLEKYALFARSGAWRDYGLPEFPHVLFLTIRQDWTESIMHDFEVHLRRTGRAQLLSAHHFLFSSTEDDHLSDVLGKRWLRAGSPRAPQEFFHA